MQTYKRVVFPAIHHPVGKATSLSGIGSKGIPHTARTAGGAMSIFIAIAVTLVLGDAAICKSRAGCKTRGQQEGPLDQRAKGQ